MIPRVLKALCVVVLAAAPALSASGQTDGRTIEVLDVSGPIDDRLAGFVIESIDAAARSGTVELVILQVDSPGAVASEENMRRLAAIVSNPPLPLVAWVGPAPARIQGGVAQVFSLAPLRSAAPGATAGLWEPTIAGDPPGFLIAEPPDPELIDTVATMRAGEPVPGLIDLVSPETASHRQLAQSLDGIEIGGVSLHTVAPFTAQDGTEGVTLLTTVFRQPGLWDRFLRLASTPEATFFFIVVGLTIAAFEFYAIGPGIAAGVAAVSLLIGGHGLATLPIRWWALALTIGAVLVMSMSYQMGGVLVLTCFGLAALVVAGFSLGDMAPQITPGIPSVVLTVAAAAFFFLMAMPTVARSRFSTQTIGREALVGRHGVAVTALTPDGEVEVEGARWRATSHREAGVQPGDRVEVVGLDGWYLEVEPESGE